MVFLSYQMYRRVILCFWKNCFWQKSISFTLFASGKMFSRENILYYFNSLPKEFREEHICIIYFPLYEKRFLSRLSFHRQREKISIGKFGNLEWKQTNFSTYNTTTLCFIVQEYGIRKKIMKAFLLPIRTNWIHQKNSYRVFLHLFIHIYISISLLKPFFHLKKFQIDKFEYSFRIIFNNFQPLP